MTKRKPASKKKRLPTLAECEKAIGEKAGTWVARCYEISCAIVNAGLVDGVAVYGHWLGHVVAGSHFAARASLPFVPHGWILLTDGRVLDPTRWVFEHVEPYLYIGRDEGKGAEGDDNCKHCSHAAFEHGMLGNCQWCNCISYETSTPSWPYDEGGNRWREATTAGRPIPAPQGKLRKTKLDGLAKNWVGALFGVDAGKLAANQLMYLANMSYDVIKRAVGPKGLRSIYEAICDFSNTSLAWIPLDNFNRARRECGLTRSY